MKEATKEQPQELTELEKVQNQLISALKDCREAQLQRDFLRDVARLRKIVCPMCKSGRATQGDEKGNPIGVCIKFRSSPETNCKWLKSLGQLIPVRDGHIDLADEYPNPNKTDKMK